MKELRELAKKLLADGAVKVVFGYEEGPRGVRPIMATDAAMADKLIFDARCVQNLATYLNPRRPHVVKLGKPAVVVKACDAKAVAGLIRETQVKREDVVEVTVVGNPIMHHLFLGLDPVELGRADTREEGGEAGEQPGGQQPVILGEQAKEQANQEVCNTNQGQTQMVD